MTKLDQVLQQMRNELGHDFIAAQVVGSDGLPFASINNQSAIDNDAASGRMVMIYNLTKKVADKLGMGSVEEELITMNDLYLLIRALGDGSFCLALAISKNAILGSARLSMTEFAPRLWEAIPQ